MIDEKRIAEIKARTEKATPGPWIRSKFGLNILTHDSEISTATQKYIGPQGNVSKEIDILECNAEFIAHAREDIPYLLGEIGSLQAQLAAYTDIGLTPGDVKDLQALCKENGLAKYVDLIVEAKRVIGESNEHSIAQDERIEQLETQLTDKTALLDAAIAGQETLQKTLNAYITGTNHLKKRIARLEDKLAESQRREQAAIKETVNQIKHSTDDICSLCQHHVKCEGKNCPEYVEGQGGTIDGKEVDFKWTCEEFNFGTCAMMENAPCNGCFDNDYKGFKWIELWETGEKG